MNNICFFPSAVSFVVVVKILLDDVSFSSFFDVFGAGREEKSDPFFSVVLEDFGGGNEEKIDVVGADGMVPLRICYIAI